MRFIEEMPLDADEAWQRNEMITAAELIQVLSKGFELSEACGDVEQAGGPRHPAARFRPAQPQHGRSGRLNLLSKASVLSSSARRGTCCPVGRDRGIPWEKPSPSSPRPS